MLRIVAALLLAGSLSAADPDPKSLAVPPDTAARATDLIGFLASRDYAERVGATKDLRKLGRLALPALRDALAASSNAEVRLRIEMLLPAAVADDLNVRVACLLADTGNKYQHELPGGKAFFAATGRSEVAKQLYADIARSANRDLLATADAPEAELRRQSDARRAALNLSALAGRDESATAITDVDVAAILFADSLLPDQGLAGGSLGVVAGGRGRGLPLVRDTQFLTALISALTDDRQEAMTGIVRRWMETREQPQSVYAVLAAMNRANLPHALPAARNLVTGKVTGGPITYRNLAITYLGRYGTATELPILEKLLADKSTIVTAIPNGPASRRRTILTCDLALAMAVLLNKLDPTDFGLDFRSGYYGSSGDAQKYNATAYSFDAETEEKADELRAAALFKYAAWKAAQKKGKK